jgi:LysM repeat protein
MKHLFFLILCSTFAWGQKPLFTEYVTGSAEAKEAQVMFYLQNVSACVLEEVQVRVSHNAVYNSTDSATFVTQLQPEKQETFVLRLSQVISEGWAWTIDTITLKEPEGENSCKEAGVLEFDKVIFKGADPPQTTAEPALQDVVMTYEIVAGDSWYGLATRYGTTPEAIASLNSRSLDDLVVGEVIKVPLPVQIPAPEPVVSEPPLFPVHAIQKGDTLYALARTYSIGVDLILKANCITLDSVLNVGLELQIPPQDAVLTNVCQ